MTPAKPPRSEIFAKETSVNEQSKSCCSALNKMHCLQWMIPVLLIPKPVNPELLHTHVMFMVLYIMGFFLEKKPCTICSVFFLVAVFLICYSGLGNCLFWSNNCDSLHCENG